MKISYKISGTPNSPVLILSNSLGSTYHMWDDLVPFLLPYFRVLQYDNRGHGGSDKPNEPYRIDQLGQDVVDLLDRLNIEKAYFCGVSMGGLVAQWLAVNVPHRFPKICISNSAAKIGNRQSWQDRIDTLQQNGMQVLVDMTLEKWFTPSFHQQRPEKIDVFRTMFGSNQVNGYCNCCHAIAGADFREDLSSIQSEILVITGDDDPVTNVDDAKFLNANITQSELVVLPGRHLVNAEVPDLYAEALISFFVGPEIKDRGMHIRTTVLGKEHVSNSLEGINSFNQAFQDLSAKIPWGQIWSRPGLSKHQRSLITLSMMIALNRPEEFRMHIRGAINNGVTVEELQELILQSAIYCGFPASHAAFKNAQDILEQEGLI